MTENSKNTEISIVMAYYNRKELLINTLKTIESSKYRDILEIIVVNDASDESQNIDNLKKIFNLNLKIININKKDKTWINPSVPYNIGFKAVTSEKIIIQNPECLHLGDIISAVNDNLVDGEYLSFGCYSVNNDIQNKINNTKKDDNYILRVKDIIPIYDKAVQVDGENGWYNHYKIRPHYLHWCTAITKKDLDIVGGFDEEFANGIAYEDNEFLYRVKKQCKIKYIKGPIVVHQYHGTTNYSNRSLVVKNQLIAQKLMK